MASCMTCMCGSSGYGQLPAIRLTFRATGSTAHPSRSAPLLAFTAFIFPVEAPLPGYKGATGPIPEASHLSIRTHGSSLKFTAAIVNPSIPCLHDCLTARL